MADNELPENVIPITTLRINRNKNKKCTCGESVGGTKQHRRYEIDTTNRLILCADCGVVVDPYDAIYDITTRWEEFSREVKSLYEQRKQILNWKPWLLPMRELERIYRGGEMLPCCPHCGRGIEAQELIINQVNKRVEIERRKFKREK